MRVFFIYAFVFLGYLMCQPVFGKTHKDIQQILKANPDTDKVKLLSDLCWDYRFVSADSALNFGGQALQLARELK